jgi:hypothetical protein
MSNTQKAKKLLPGPLVDERYHITGRTRNRWKKDPKLNFPKPASVINGREYYNEADLDAFDEMMAAKGRADARAA